MSAPKPLLDSAWAWLKLRPGYLLALVAVLLYSQTIGFDYALDDLAVVTENRFVKQGIAGMGEVLSTSYWKGFSDNAPAYYRPLSLLSFCLEVELTGGQPWLPHAVNVLLYGLTALLAHLFLRRIVSPPLAFAATLLWLVHPTHVEVVANVKSRDELLGFLLGLGMLIAGMSGRLVTCGVLMLLAMMAKESSLTLLAVLPAALYWATDASPSTIVGRTLAPAAGALTWWICRWSALGTPIIEHPDNIWHITQNALVGSSSLSEHIGSVLAMGSRYAGLLLAPITLSFDYSIGQVPLVGLTHPLALLGAALFAGWMVLLACNLRRDRPVGFALFAGLATFSIASNAVVLVMGSTMGERYLYVPSLFACLLVVIPLGRLHRGPMLESTNWRFLVPVLVLSLLGTGRSLARIPDWQDNSTLIEADMAENPGNPRIAGHYAIVRIADKKPIAGTVDQLNRSLDLHSYEPGRYHWVGVHANTALGDVYRQSGRLDEALHHYEAAVALEPAQFQAWFNIGWILYELGQPRESATAYGTGLRFKADHPLRDADPTRWHLWWLNTCISARDAGAFEMALETCERAIDAKPMWGQAWGGLGLVYQALGEHDRAAEHFAKARQLDPSL